MENIVITAGNVSMPLAEFLYLFSSLLISFGASKIFVDHFAAGFEANWGTTLFILGAIFAILSIIARLVW
jgi:TM2 domain-containing membrane protein YozV